MFLNIQLYSYVGIFMAGAISKSCSWCETFKRILWFGNHAIAFNKLLTTKILLVLVQ